MKERVIKYIKLTTDALDVARKNVVDDRANALLDMASRYLNDGKYFYDSGDLETALVALVYAHAWIDVAAFLKFISVDDSNKFMVD